MRANTSSAKKARRSNGHGTRRQTFRATQAANPLSYLADFGRAPPSLGVPVRQAYLCAADRRWSGPDACNRLDERERGQGAEDVEFGGGRFGRQEDRRTS